MIFDGSIPSLKPAVRSRDGRIFTGTDHGDAFNNARNAGVHEDSFIDDGFDAAGKYLTRDEAEKRFGGATIEDYPHLSEPLAHVCFCTKGPGLHEPPCVCECGQPAMCAGEWWHSLQQRI